MRAPPGSAGGWGDGVRPEPQIESGPGSQRVALPSMAAVTLTAGMMLHCSE